MKNAMELRTLVMENALTLGRLNRDTLGKADYEALTKSYRNTLDALTEWAGKDYAHTSTKKDADMAYAEVKNILSLFTVTTTNENGEVVEERIIIDQASMRTLRDLATKPKRLYSKEYTVAEKARKNAQKTFEERTADLITLGAPEREADEKVEDYIASLKELNLNLVSEGIDMLEMYKSASAVLAVKTLAVENIKKAGNWTWKRPVAVDLNTFAELVENYIADCLIDNYNLKSSKTVREERAEARTNAQAEKKAEAEAKKEAPKTEAEAPVVEETKTVA